MLKNRQSSKTPVNLKRRAPSLIPAEEPVSAPPGQNVPTRSSTFPTEMMAQLSTSDSGRRQRSLDNTRAMGNNQPADSGTQSAWIASTPELLTDTMQTPEPMSATSMNHSFANPEPSSLAWAQQFNNPNNVPDLMPIMFPSDDPFAYPTQPMSTLEDDHFRHDRSGMHFSFDSKPQQPTGMGTGSPSDLSGASVSTPTFDAFPNQSNFPAGNTSGVKSSIPSRLQANNSQSMNSSRLHSPISQTSETLSSPDLVSIPNQNFVWEGYNFQPTNTPTNTNINVAADAGMQQDHPPLNGVQDFSMGLDDNTMAMNMDLGISFDDLFGNDVTRRPGPRAPNDEWTQWMNAGV